MRFTGLFVACFQVALSYVFDCEGFISGDSSNSQWRQDWFIAHNLNVSGSGVFVEVGAFHPHILSNSLALERCLGYRGLCIEPNPENHEQFRRERTCEFVNHCVWSERKFLNLQLTGDPIEASLVPDLPSPSGDHSLRVECISLLDALEMAAAKFNTTTIDVLLLDAEGSELEILKNFRSAVDRFNIRLVIVEVSKIGGSTQLQRIFFENQFHKVAVLGGDWVFANARPL